MYPIKITLSQEPIADQRPRSSHKNGCFRTYDPLSKARQNTKAAIKKEIENLPLNLPYNEKINLGVYFYFPMPKNPTKAKRTQIQNDPAYTNRPDLDNLVKFILDCGNGILWADDKIITHIYTSKEYSENPRTEIEIVNKKFTQSFYE